MGERNCGVVPTALPRGPRSGRAATFRRAPLAWVETDSRSLWRVVCRLASTGCPAVALVHSFLS